MDRVGVQEGGGLGETVGLVEDDAVFIIELARHRLGHGGTAAENQRQAGEVVVFNLRVAKEAHHHGRWRAPYRYPPALDQTGGGVAVPAGQDHQGAAQEQRQVHGILQAQHMEHGRHRQKHRLRIKGTPQAGRVQGGDQGTVTVPAALGLAGGTGGVRQHAQLVRAERLSRRPAALRQGIVPERHRRVPGRARRAGDPGGRAQVAVVETVQPIAVMEHQGARQAAVVHAAAQGRVQLLRTDRHPGAAVVHIVLQFVGGAHGVHRHHRRADGGHRIERDHELRAILTQQQHPVAAHHAPALAQIAGQPLHPVLDLGIAEHRVVKNQRRLVRKTAGHLRQAVRQRQRRHRHGVAQATGIKAEMIVIHGVSKGAQLKRRSRSRAITSFMISLAPP